MIRIKKKLTLYSIQLNNDIKWTKITAIFLKDTELWVTGIQIFLYFKICFGHKNFSGNFDVPNIDKPLTCFGLLSNQVFQRSVALLSQD
jgi:hypothetical protein